MLWATVDRCGRRGILLLSMTMTGLASLILLGLMECKQALVAGYCFLQVNLGSDKEKLLIVFGNRSRPLMLLQRHYEKLVLGLKRPE